MSPGSQPLNRQSYRMRLNRLSLPILTEKKQSAKQNRSVFLYIEPGDELDAVDDDFAQCATCRLWTGDEHETCMILGKDFNVPGSASCNVYIKEHPHPDWHGHEEALVKPEDVGYVNRPVRCENCVAFKAGKAERGTCEFFHMLNQKLPDAFDLDEDVHSYGCCNGQTAK